MNTVEKKDYTIISDLTEREAKEIANFIESPTDSIGLIKIVEERSEKKGTIYRGITYRKKDLKIGEYYQHWESLSSWSYELNVALGFALNNYIPEGCIDEVMKEFEHEPQSTWNATLWEKAYAEFVHVLFVCEDGFGFDVNQHLLHVLYQKEKEVIVNEGKWKIASIEEKKSEQGKIYYEVQTERIA